MRARAWFVIATVIPALLAACPGSSSTPGDSQVGNPDRAVSDGPTGDGPTGADTVGATDTTGATDATYADAAGGNTISGTIKGKAFPVAASHWIGVPDPGSPPTIFFLLEPALTCTDVSKPLWDKPLGTKQVLEIAVDGTAAKTYQIGVDAIANYLSGTFNPDASGGTVTVTAVTAGTSITGTFQLQFGTDTISGAFNAPYCASGVEP